MSAAADSRVGTELAGYRLESLIGRGGMGVVYRARDLALDRDVALKLLVPHLAEDVSFRERFLTESRVAASLEHPNVVPIHDAGEIEGQLYIVMRLVVGSDLKVVLRGGPLETARAVRIAEQIASALDAAHARGLVHRDVKPSNVLLDEHEHVYLADFGLSRYLGDAASTLGAGRSLGTADYVAPEQIRCEEVDGRTDVYALGCLLYETLAGEPPFRRGSDAATLFAQLEEDPPTLPGLEEVLPKALAKSPVDRYPTCGELIAEAGTALGITHPRRNPWPLAFAAVGVALIAAALLGFLFTRDHVGDPAGLPGADQLIHIDPIANQVSSRVPVGRKTTGIALGDGKVWISSLADGDVWRFDPKTKKMLRLSTGGSPTSIARRPGLVVVANGDQHSLAFIDEASEELTSVEPLSGAGNGVVQLAATRDAIWFADPGTRVVGIYPKGNTRRYDIPRDHPGVISSYKSFDGIAALGDSVWIAAEGGVVWRLDAHDGNIVAKVPLGFVPRSIAAGDGAVWVSSLLGDSVVRIDAATNRVAATIHVGSGVAGIAVGGGAVWVTNSFEGTVSRIDPATNRVVATIPVGALPESIAADNDGVWVGAHTRNLGPSAGQIGIGVLSDCRGPWAFAYQGTIAGADLALLDRGGTLAGRAITSGVQGVSIGGHPVRTFLGCSDGTNTSALTEARRLVDEVGVDVLVGPLAGNEGLALQDFARNRPRVAFVDGSASSYQSDPAPNFFRFHTDGGQWMAGLGAYAYRNLGWRHAVTIAAEDADVFAWTQVAGFVAEFCSLGGQVTKRIWIPPGTQDFAATVAQIPPSGVDGVVIVARPEPALGVANGYPPLRKDLSQKMILSVLDLDPQILRLGPRAVGLVLGNGVPLLNDQYVARMHQAFPKLSVFGLGTGFDVYYHDAVAATLKALDAVSGDLSDGGQRFQTALAHVELDASPQGHVALDAEGQGVAANYLLQFKRAALPPEVMKTVPDVERTFGGYLRPTDPPPSESTPACVKRIPPPWAR